MKPAITPGEILLEDYLIPMDISQNALARALGISPQSIKEIVLGRPSVFVSKKPRSNRDGFRGASFA